MILLRSLSFSRPSRWGKHGRRTVSRICSEILHHSGTRLQTLGREILGIRRCTRFSQEVTSRSSDRTLLHRWHQDRSGLFSWMSSIDALCRLVQKVTLSHWHVVGVQHSGTGKSFRSRLRLSRIFPESRMHISAALGRLSGFLAIHAERCRPSNGHKFAGLKTNLRTLITTAKNVIHRGLMQTESKLFLLGNGEESRKSQESKGFRSPDSILRGA